MPLYGDILRRALAASPWEARSVNGALHDTVDWLGSGVASFPLSVARVGCGEEGEEAVRSALSRRGATLGSWGYFEWAGISASRGRSAENPRRLVWPLPEAEPCGGVALMEKMAAAARDARLLARGNRAEAMGKNMAVPFERPPGGPSGGSDSGLAALAALRAAARRRDAVPARAGAGGESRRARPLERPSGGSDSGLAALAALRAAARREDAAPVSENGSEASAEPSSGGMLRRWEGAAAKEPWALPPLSGDRLFEALAAQPSAKCEVDGRRVVLATAADPLAVHLLRGCVLAEAAEGRRLGGLEGLASADELRACSSAVYLSWAALGWVPGGFPEGAACDASAEGLWAAASLGMLDASVLPSDEDAGAFAAVAADVDMRQAFVLLDAVGCPEAPQELAPMLERVLRVCRHAVVLAEPSAVEGWGRLLGRLPSDLPRFFSLDVFAVDGASACRGRGRERFFLAWWRWFGSGSRWGFGEMRVAVERAEGVLGLGFSGRGCDLGLLSVLAAQLRDGGSVASADDVVDALADRFPDKTLLHAVVEATMASLLRSGEPSPDGRAHVPAKEWERALDEALGEGAGCREGAAGDAAGPFAASAALPFARSSSALASLLGWEGDRVEVRFSALLACLAARWLVPFEASALEVADRLLELSRHVPAGGWGRIVVQVALLAQQRGQPYMGRVVFERLYAVAPRESRAMLVKASLGVFLDTGGKLPSLWRDFFFDGRVGSLQAEAVAEARCGGWLRDDNMRVLRRADDALFARACEGPVDGLPPERALRSAAWVDVILRAAVAPDGRALLAELASDAASDDALARRRALGCFDCLAWACVFKVGFPVDLHRADMLRPEVLALVADAALDELARGGAAYAECAGFLWFFAIECPQVLTEDLRLRLIARAAAVLAAEGADDARGAGSEEGMAGAGSARAAEGAGAVCAAEGAGDGDSVERGSAARAAMPVGRGGGPSPKDAYRALAALALLDGPPPHAVGDVLAAGRRAEREAAPSAEACGFSARLHASMAACALGALSREEAGSLVVSVSPDGLSDIDKRMQQMFLMDDSLEGCSASKDGAPPQDAPRLSCEERASLRRRWRACREALGNL